MWRQMNDTGIRWRQLNRSSLYESFCTFRFGFPERIHHDQGKEFDNHLFDILHQLTGIRKSRTTPYHPQGDGQTERANRTIISMLRTLSENEKLNWPKHLKKLSFAFNTTVSKSTGFSPHYLMFGRSARLPIDRIFGIEPNEGEVKMQKSYAKYVMNQAFQISKKLLWIRFIWKWVIQKWVPLL